MTPNIKGIAPPLMIFALLAAAIASLMLSGLSVEKALSVQNGAAALFLNSLQAGAMNAAVDAAVFVVQGAILPLLPFFALSVICFVSVLWLKPGIKMIAVSLAMLSAFVLAMVLALGASPALFIVMFGYFALLLPSELDERKTKFRVGYAFSSSMLRYVNLAAAAAIFAAILLLPNLEKVAGQQMVSGAVSFLPDENQMQSAQNDFASALAGQTSSAMKNIIDSEYYAIPENKQTACSGFRDRLKSGADAYGTSLLSQLSAGNSSAGAGHLAQEALSGTGVFSMMANALPFVAALSLLALLELLKPFLAALGGAIYSLAAKKAGQ